MHACLHLSVCAYAVAVSLEVEVLSTASYDYDQVALLHCFSQGTSNFLDWIQLVELSGLAILIQQELLCSVADHSVPCQEEDAEVDFLRILAEPHQQ